MSTWLKSAPAHAYFLYKGLLEQVKLFIVSNDYYRANRDVGRGTVASQVSEV